MRNLNLVDQIIIHFDKCFLSGSENTGFIKSNIPDPSASITKTNTNSLNGNSNPFVIGQSTKHASIPFMRINHAGEVCAQALYHGQALVARNKLLENKLLKAAEEEQQHLDWCSERINELGGKKSILNPLWAVGSFAVGALAGLAGDKISLGFIAETERQVTEHLDKHLALLPADDDKSREILIKMREDEKKHATEAIQEGGGTLASINSITDEGHCQDYDYCIALLLV